MPRLRNNWILSLGCWFLKAFLCDTHRVSFINLSTFGTAMFRCAKSENEWQFLLKNWFLESFLTLMFIRHQLLIYSILALPFLEMPRPKNKWLLSLVCWFLETFFNVMFIGSHLLIYLLLAPLYLEVPKAEISGNC